MFTDNELRHQAKALLLKNGPIKPEDLRSVATRISSQLDGPYEVHKIMKLAVELELAPAPLKTLAPPEPHPSRTLLDDVLARKNRHTTLYYRQQRAEQIHRRVMMRHLELALPKLQRYAKSCPNGKIQRTEFYYRSSGVGKLVSPGLSLQEAQRLAREHNLLSGKSRRARKG